MILWVPISILFLITNWLTTFSIQWWFLPTEVIIMMFIYWWLPTSMISSMLINWNSTIRKAVHSPFIISSIIYSYQYRVIDCLCYGLYSITLIILFYTSTQTWPLGACSSSVLCPFYRVHPSSFFFEYLLTFWHHKVFQAHPIYSLVKR